MTNEKPIDFDHIYLQGKQHKSAGKLKLVPGGIGWREAATGTVTTLKADDFKKWTWLRAARDYQLKIALKNGTFYKFDGFPREAYDTLKEFSKENFGLTLEAKELSLKGWNWGKAEVQSHQLEFVVQGRTMFELPFNEISSTAVSAKNEVTVEMALNDNSAQNKKIDSLVDIRFYIPPSAEMAEDDEQEDAMDAATTFCNHLKSSTDLGGLGGAESLVIFQELPFLVPRGRYEADLYTTFMRLRGKSYDYKIAYSSILKLFLFPKSDDLHVMLVISLDPPLRQGQTRYPFLILQFSRDSEIATSVTLTDEAKAKFAGKLEAEYEGPQYEVFSQVLKVVSDKKLIVPGSFKSFHGQSCIKCSMKANEGQLYLLEKSFIFIPKPTTLIPHDDLASVTFSRVDGAANSRTFDIRLTMRGGAEYGFSNINKEELNLIENFLREKKIKFQNEIVETKKKKYASESDAGSSEDEAVPVRSDDEGDESSTDEDYEPGQSDESDGSGDDDEEDEDYEED